MKERSWQVAVRGTEMWVKENVPLGLPFGKKKVRSLAHAININKF